MASFKPLKDIYRSLSKEDLITILERSNDAIFIMNSEKYLYLNQAAADILEYDNPIELIGTDSFKHVTPEFREISKNYLINRRKGDAVPTKYTMQLLTKTGRRVDIETNVSVINFHGTPASLAITRDISENKKIRNDLENALTLNETQNQMLIQFLNSVKEEVTIFDSEMRFLYVNDALASRTGNPKEVYIGKHITDYVPNIQSTERYEKYQEVIRTGTPVNFDRVQPIGDDIWLDIFAFKVGDGIGIITSNITDTVRFESTLLELNEYMSRINQCESLEDIFNLTLDAMANALKHYSHDIFMREDDYMVQVANMNLPSGAHIPLTASSIVVKSFLENRSVVVNDVSAEPNYFKIKNPSTGNAFDEYELSRAELVVPIRIEGKAVGVLNVESTEINSFTEQDITLLEILASTVATAVSRFQQSRETRKYEERLQTLLSHATNMSMVSSLDEIVEITEKGVNEVLGVNRGSLGLVEEKDLNFKYLWNIPNALPFTLSLDGPGISIRAYKTKETQLVADVFQDPDYHNAIPEADSSHSELAIPIIIGKKVFGVLNLESIKRNAFSENDKKLVEVLTSHISLAVERIRIAEERNRVTKQLLEEQIKTEQERELSELKTRFIFTATHEIRTPLASIQGYTELVQLDPENLTDAQLQYFEVIQRNVQRLTKLTDDLLDLQRFEVGRLSLNVEPVNVLGFVGDVENEFLPILKVKNQTLEVTGVDVVVCMDRLRVMQVLINLLSNAFKFSPEGAEVGINVVELDNEVRFSVSDMGVGIREEDVGKLFTPFPGILVNGNVGGTGLGLSICKSIVELHGGKIWAESEGKGKGSTFIFSIPSG